MQDVIKHRAQHTDGHCRACSIYSTGQKYQASARRLKRLMRDVIAAKENCPHLNTKLMIEPTGEGSNGAVLEGERFKLCRDCLKVEYL